MNINIEEEKLNFAGVGGEPEIFYTIEGEGEFIGTPSVFFRMSGCNLTCKGFASEDSPHGCDSFVSWSQQNGLSFKDTFELLEKNLYIKRLASGAIMKLTGGEPLIQQKQLLKFVFCFIDRYGFVPRIDFESNATIMPNEKWVNELKATFTTSPKLSTNGDPEKRTYKPKVLKHHVDIGSSFKFVITSSEDIEEIWKKYVNNNDIKVPLSRIWFMPCCGSRKELIDNCTPVAEYAKECNVNFSPRLQLLVWDKALRA